MGEKLKKGKKASLRNGQRGKGTHLCSLRGESGRQNEGRRSVYLKGKETGEDGGDIEIQHDRKQAWGLEENEERRREGEDER